MNNRIIYYIIIGLIGAIILPILLQSGYIFVIDQALNTNGWIPKIGSNNYWIGWISQVFIFLNIPIWVLEKLLVFITFSLPVAGIYLYFKKFVELQSNSALFFALSFSIFNPMLYSRFLDGQVNIYVFYALFPLFLYFIKYFFEYKTIKSALIVGFWSMVLVCTTLHAAYFIFFVFLIFTLGYIREILREKQIFSVLLGFFIVFCIQLFWLIPLLYSPDEKVFSTVSQIERFDHKQQQAFANIPQSKNPYREILSMRGYWGDYENRFVASNDILNNNGKNDWIYFIWFLIIIGLIYTCKNKTQDRYIFLSLGTLAVILSLGVTNGTIFGPINRVLYDYLPYYSGFREPQKFVLLLIMSYIYFGYFGIIAIGDFFKRYKIQKIIASSVLLFCILSPILYNFNMLFGFRGQVSIQEYPKEWKDIKHYISMNSCETCEYDTVIFPWHGYMSISWTHRIVGSWLTRYLGDNILYGDTIEIGQVYTSSTRQESKIIETYISPGGSLRQTETKQDAYANFIQDMTKIGLLQIILLKESDYIWYQEILDDMLSQGFLELGEENSMIKLYKIK